MDNRAQVEDPVPGALSGRPDAAVRTPRGVLVLGMHRSGTSAVAGMTNLLGLATSASNDLITQMAWNPGGHWESRSLTRFNDQLLTEMGHTWWYPPPSGSGYSEVASRIVAPPEAAARYFDRLHPSEPWVWKDPRTCLTLPFWRQALHRPLAGIVVFRNPIDVATSLEFRNSLPLSFGVALWEHYAVAFRARRRDAAAGLVLRRPSAGPGRMSRTDVRASTSSASPSNLAWRATSVGLWIRGSGTATTAGQRSSPARRA